MKTIENAIKSAPFKISCVMDGRNWNGNYFELSKAADMLKRLQANPSVKSISTKGF